MKITLDNYEAYFLDYMEGQLNSEQLSELSLFLSLHPQLKPQLDELEIIPIKSDSYTFKNKKLLKKFDFKSTPIGDNNFNDFCIAFNEHILSDEKILELRTICDISQRHKHDFKVFQKVYLKPQFNLKYSRKKNLYRKVVIHKFISSVVLRIATVAASIALVITIYLVSSNKNENHNSQMIATYIQEPVISKPNKVSTAPIIAKENTRKLPYKRISNNAVVVLTNELTVDTPIIISTVKNREKLYLAQIPSLNIKPIEIQTNKRSKMYEPEIETGKQNHTQTLSATLSSAYQNIKNEAINFDGLKNKEGNISLFKLVKAGITGFNKITESNMSLTEKTDSTGNITAYSFNSEIIKFQKNVSTF